MLQEGLYVTTYASMQWKKMSMIAKDDVFKTRESQSGTRVPGTQLHLSYLFMSVCLSPSSAGGILK